MSESLANKYRPKCWGEVVGQTPIVSVLSAQTIKKRIHQAYLFVGSAGSGKTSVARIFSTSLNGNDYEPIEIDAASNNGVDSIRKIIDDSQQAPFGYQYKVYILDEAHQLTKAAWDSALKLIEEPPETAIFIFCTTNPSKIPETILSRVQRFDFKRVSYRDISSRLAFILNEEFGRNIEYESSALDRLAISSNGCVRQAIQYLDKCVDSGKPVTNELVESVVGRPSAEMLYFLTSAIFSGDAKRSLDTISVLNGGTDALTFFDDLISFAVQIEIYDKTGDKSFCDLPEDIKECISHSNGMAERLVNRLISIRGLITNDNGFSMAKAVCMEFCGGK